MRVYQFRHLGNSKQCTITFRRYRAPKSKIFIFLAKMQVDRVMALLHKWSSLDAPHGMKAIAACHASHRSIFHRSRLVSGMKPDTHEAVAIQAPRPLFQVPRSPADGLSAAAIH